MTTQVEVDVSASPSIVADSTDDTIIAVEIEISDADRFSAPHRRVV